MPAADRLQDLVDALDAEAFERVALLLAEQDRAAHELAAQPPSAQQREQLIDLQRLQLSLIETLRGRRDGIADELQAMAQNQRAHRAYREQEPR